MFLCTDFYSGAGHDFFNTNYFFTYFNRRADRDLFTANCNMREGHDFFLTNILAIDFNRRAGNDSLTTNL